jgi:HEPN domain-containing protein
MAVAKRSSAETLLLKAAADEEILNFDSISDSILGFHAQQAVEKLMKALLTQLNVPYEFTHTLNRLLLLLENHGEFLPSTAITLGDLTDFAVEYRYSYLPPTLSHDKSELRESVRILREHIVGRVAALSTFP